jgi:SAM-dependent methyltransferase
MLSWIREHLAGDLRPSFRVLDVAAGTGRMSRLVAPNVKEVIAVDLTEEMMAVGKEQAKMAGINNIHWIMSKAQQMPFMDNAFDVVVSRLAVHHWNEPQSIVSEIARVCKPGGKVVLIDIVTPDHLTAAQGKRLNDLERLRDPSHVFFWRLSELFGFLEKACPTLSPLPLVDRKDNQVSLGQWLDVTDTPDASRKEISTALEAELERGQTDGGSITGFRPHRSADGNLHFIHSYAFLAAQKL